MLQKLAAHWLFKLHGMPFASRFEQVPDEPPVSG
jgi:hypothetical protein